MRPRLYELVTEQLRTVQQQIAEFQVLEQQLAQVLQRLQTTAPASHADGCQCLDSEPSEAQEPHPLSIPRKGEAMSTSTLVISFAIFHHVGCATDESATATSTPVR